MSREISALKKQIEDLLFSTGRFGIELLVDWLASTDFYSAPASRDNHSCFAGGLAFHSCSVLNTLSDRVNTYPDGYLKNWNEQSTILCSLLHDICKIDMYRRTGAVYTINDGMPIGHGSKSVILASRYITLTTFEIFAIIHHMGVPETYNDKMAFNKALEMYPEMILLHLADFESSAIIEPNEMKSRRK